MTTVRKAPAPAPSVSSAPEPVASVRHTLATMLRPISVIVGLVAGGIVTAIVRYGVLTLAWYSHLPRTGLAFWALSLIVATVGEGTGGYVAARLSRSRGLAAAVAVGAIGLILGITSLVFRPSEWWVWWLSALYLLLGMSAAVIGGWLALRGRSDASVTAQTATVQRDPDGRGAR